MAEYRSSVLALRGKLEGACAGAGAGGGADAGLSLSPRGGLAALEAAGPPDAPAAGAAWLELAELQARAGAAAAAAGADGDAAPAAEPAAAEPVPRAAAPPGPPGQAAAPPPPPEAAAADVDPAGEAADDVVGWDDAEGSAAGTDGGEEPGDARAPEREQGAAGPEPGAPRGDGDGAARGAGAEEVLALAVGWLRGAAAARGGGGGGADAHAAPDAVPKIAALLSGARGPAWRTRAHVRRRCESGSEPAVGPRRRRAPVDATHVAEQVGPGCCLPCRHARGGAQVGRSWLPLHVRPATHL